MGMRYKLAPGSGDCPPNAAAREMWLTLEQFNEKLPELLKRGFPAPDPTTGNYDMDAIKQWRKQRHPHLYGTQPTTAATARNAGDVVFERLGRLRRSGE